MLLESDPSYFLLRGPTLPPADELKSMLGRIVINFAQPLGSGYMPEDASPYHLREPNHTPLSNVKRALDAAKGSTLELRLSSLGAVNAQREQKKQSTLESPEIHAYELHKQPEVFAKLMQQKDIRQWVDAKTSVLGNPLWMITGVLIWTTARSSDHESKTEKGKAKASIPLGAASSATAASMGIPFDGSKIEDVNISATEFTSASKTHAAESNDSQIFAIQYKTIRKRKRDAISGFPATFVDRGPRVEGQRTWGDEKHQKQAQPPDDVIELDQSNVAWTDQFEDLEEDKKTDMQIEDIEIDGIELKLAFI